MYSSMFESVVHVLLISGLFYSDFAIANDYKKDGTIDRDARSEEGYRNGMWFGPRLGKRSLRLTSEIDRQTLYRMLEAADAVKYYYNQLPYFEAQADDPELRVTKKVIFTPKLGRGIDEDDVKQIENINFTPRLGRRLASDSVGVTLPDQDIERNDPDQVNTKTKYFSPRLGRNKNFSPRLGRDLIYDIFPPEARMRVVRSVNKNDTTSM